MHLFRLSNGRSNANFTNEKQLQSPARSTRAFEEEEEGKGQDEVAVVVAVYLFKQSDFFALLRDTSKHVQTALSLSLFFALLCSSPRPFPNTFALRRVDSARAKQTSSPGLSLPLSLSSSLSRPLLVRAFVDLVRYFVCFRSESTRFCLFSLTRLL
jgi:hypothetical protein